MNMATEETAVSGGRRNLYVSAQDQTIWDRAEKLAPESLSALVTGLLRRYVEQREAATKRIVVQIEDRDGNVTRKAFKGRMLVDGFRTEDQTTMASAEFFAAHGASGGLALWIERGTPESFQAYGSFEDAADDDWPEDFLSAVSSALGEEYAEEIDL